MTIVSYLIVVLTIAFLVLVSAVVLLLIVVVFLILDSCVPYPCLFPYRSLDRPFPYPYPYPCLAWRRAKTSFRLGFVLLDFCFFCVILPLILSRITPGQMTKPRSDLA